MNDHAQREQIQQWTGAARDAGMSPDEAKRQIRALLAAIEQRAARDAEATQ